VTLADHRAVAGIRADRGSLRRQRRESARLCGRCHGV